ncbi:MAG: hypothetical protein WBC78_12435 [Candidatus Sulfotelmatobacter sp.]
MASLRLVLLRWKIEVRAWLEGIWESRWSGIALTGMATLVCAVLSWWIPSPGVSVAFMGVAAAMMTARTKATGTEKAVWMLIISTLLVSEVLAIRKDRREHDEQTARLLQLEKESLDNITGGDSYAYVAAGMTSGPPPYPLFVWVKGKHAVHDLAAEMQTVIPGGTRESTVRQLQSMHPLPLGNGDFLPGPTPIGESVSSGSYGITVVSRSSWIQEQLDISQCSDGVWSEAIKMNGPGEKENKIWEGRPGCNWHP